MFVYDSCVVSVWASCRGCRVPGALDMVSFVVVRLEVSGV